MKTYTIKHNGYAIGQADGKNNAVDAVIEYANGLKGHWVTIAGEIRFIYCDQNNNEGRYTIQEARQ